MSSSFSPLTEHVLYCHQNDLLEDQLGQAMLKIFNAGVCDDVVARMFEQRASKHKFHKAFYGGAPFKTPKLTKGDYVIGYDRNDNELRSSIQYLNANCITIAGTGAGKTTASYFKILQIAPHVQGLWLFDLRKREFRILKPLLAKAGVNLIILPGRALRINPLQRPLGVALSDWVPRVADMLVEVLNLPPRASKLLQTKLFLLYRRFENRK